MSDNKGMPLNSYAPITSWHSSNTPSTWGGDHLLVCCAEKTWRGWKGYHRLLGTFEGFHSLTENRLPGWPPRPVIQKKQQFLYQQE